VAETDPHRSLPQGILECWIGRLARRLAGRFRSGRPYAVKIATVTFRHRKSYLLWISRFIPPVYHVASLGWLRRREGFYHDGKIEYDAMTGQTETDRGRRQQDRWPVPRGAEHGRPVGLHQGAVL
jgi:hypothetical protein